MLTVEFEDLSAVDFDLGLTGFDDAEVAAIDAIANAEFEPGTEDEQGQLDTISAKIVTCPHCKQEFDARAA